MGVAPLEDFTQAYPKFLSCQAQNLDAFSLPLILRRIDIF